MKRMPPGAVIGAIMILTSWIAPTSAEVLASGPDGFHVRLAHEIQAPPARVWEALLAPGGWWHPDHTYSGDARNLSLTLPPGGCFCEALPSGGARHMAVLLARPGELLRLSGGLGPLQAEPASGVMDWRLSPHGEAGSRFTLDYRVRGVAGEQWAGPVDWVLGQQAARLVRYLESGDPEEAMN